MDRGEDVRGHELPLALGPIVVLVAFLFQTSLSSPTIMALFAAPSGPIPSGGPQVVVVAADSFEALAFSVFLYLNL